MLWEMSDPLMTSAGRSRTRPATPDADPVVLAERILKGSEYDFGSLQGTTALVLQRPGRRGVRVFAARTTALPDEALDAILAWRLGQYVLTGFYDPRIVVGAGMATEPRESVHDADIHFLAVDDEGGLLAYITLKQPPEIDGTLLYGHRDRPLFPCEEVHGRAWQNSLLGVNEIALPTCWEFGRFVKEQRRGSQAIAHRAVLELGLNAGRLLRHPRYQEAFQLVTGDLDPEVALKSLRFFFVPVATFPAHRASLPAGHPLAPRYEGTPTAPFVANPSDVDNATYVRWADLDLALSYEDESAAIRLMALRQFVRVKESSLKRPLLPPEDTDYPVDALTSASSEAASAALWRSAERRRIPWRALTFGPGETLPIDEVLWIVQGFVQALILAPPDRFHLAGLGREVVFLPHDPTVNEAVQLVAATPGLALATERERFEDFWRHRQHLFETATESLYSMEVV
jgi:hypothetical protein